MNTNIVILVLQLGLELAENYRIYQQGVEDLINSDSETISKEQLRQLQEKVLSQSKKVQDLGE